jgi:hypothetical protein
LIGKSRERETISQQEETLMKRFLGLAIGLFSVIGFTSSADAIRIKVAEVQNGVAFIKGSDAAGRSAITWEGQFATSANPGGAFSFNGVIPADCVATLSDGTSTIEVVVLDCTPVSVAPAPVPRTGQTLCYDNTGNSGATVTCAGTGQDGALQRGVVWPNPRFTDNNNGTITDNLTGLTWLKDQACLFSQTWSNALAAASTLADGNVACGLTDGSVAGDWRLPNRNELTSLLDLGDSGLTGKLPAGHPFLNNGGNLFWTSTTVVVEGLTSSAWIVYFLTGEVRTASKNSTIYVTAVRGGS